MALPKIKTVIVLAVKPGETHVDQLSFKNTDEEYIDDTFDSFDDYVKYYVNEKLNEYSQGGFMSIAMSKEDALLISETIKKAL